MLMDFLSNILSNGKTNQDEIIQPSLGCRFTGHKHYAFTLAEVLITLGIIGVVAAMTLPTLIQNYRKHEVETRLAKFYSVINQAVRMAEVEYGDKKFWFEELTGAQMDEDGKPIEGSSDAQKWFNKYLAPHLKIAKEEILSNGSLRVYFPDGTSMSQASPNHTRDWLFYTSNPQKCNDKSGICVFWFNFVPNDTSASWKYHYNKGFEPYKYNWDGNYETLMTSGSYNCTEGKRNAYCAAVIQYNGWKIPKDYPHKF